MSARVRDLLAVAAGPEAQGDQSWHAEGTRRLYFQHPTDIDAAGMVDVNDNGREPVTVRVEAWVSPEIAAEIISHITGREKLAARKIREDEAEQERKERVSEKSESEAPHGDGLDFSASQLKLERADTLRESELDAVIAATGGLMGLDADEKPAKTSEPLDVVKEEILRLAEEQKSDDASEGEMEEVA